MKRSATPVLIAFVAALLFGAATPASKVLLASLPPFQLAGFLYLGAALAMLPALLLRSHVRLTRLDAANRHRLLGAVVVGGIVAPVLVLAALRVTPAGSVALLLNFEMVATAVLGALVFAEPLRPIGWVGAAGIVIAGVLLSGGDRPHIVGTALVAAACVFWGLDNHLTALIDGMTPAISTWWKGAVAGTVNLAIGVTLAPLTATTGQIGAALLVGALAYGVSIALHVHAAQRLGAVRAQAVFSSAPFLGAALSYCLLAEPLGARVLLAGALLIGSAALLLSDLHAHGHTHVAVAHIHSHRHDDGHHAHAHDAVAPAARHSHPHTHEELVHAHPHWPDLHHRHKH